jgi:hypothetical protein
MLYKINPILTIFNSSLQSDQYLLQPEGLRGQGSLENTEVHMENTVFWDVTPCGVPEDGILHSHCHENLKLMDVYSF